VAGPSSVITALSVCGLPTDRFCFFGFLPAKSAARRVMLKEVCDHSVTSVFFESRHRIVSSLEDICQVLGETRQICVARELTKAYETVLQGDAADIHRQISDKSEWQKGEFVVVIKGEEKKQSITITPQTKALLKAIAAEVAPRKAAALVAEHTGANKKELYQWLISQSSD